MSNKCVIYVRVSTDKQTVENQINELTRVAEAKNLEIVEIIKDEGISGALSYQSRNGTKRLIELATKRKISQILTYSICRIGRNLKDLVLFLDEVHSLGCEMYFHTQMIDTSTPTGKMMFQLIGIFSEFEKEMIKTRVISGQNRARKEGKKIGRPTKMNESLEFSIMHMRTNQVPVHKIAKDLKIGVGTVYKTIEKYNEDYIRNEIAKSETEVIRY